MAIQVLDQGTINKIAAGEVIERPSSVVKELVENAIDAKATSITVEIKDGGISFIRVTDNGCGIEKAELPVAFLRHSTSKIKSVEDLLCVSSLGFRGEALSSIASVAQVELITKTKAAFTGARYVIEGGKEISLEEVGAPDGTTFIVRNLFYNTPVRRKFLKTAMTEASYVSALVEHLALSHPDVSFRFINNNQNKLHTSGNDNLRDIIYHVHGRDISNNLLEVNKKTQDIEIHGYIGKPMICRGNRTYENYFINGRFIKSNIIAKAIEEAYKGFIMLHQYPYTALHFTINPEMMDVNVHPTKMELRFSKNEFVFDFVQSALRDALTHKELIPEVRVSSEKEIRREEKELELNNKKESGNVRAPEPFEVNRLKIENVKPHVDIPVVAEEKAIYNSKPEKKDEQILQQNASKAIKEPVEQKQEDDTRQLSLFNDEEKKLMDSSNKPDYRLIGQLFDTYWLMEFEDKLFVMDQHAAHEKILYEKTMHLLENKQMTTQMINPPIILSLNMREQQVLKSNMEVFEKLGYEIEEFGGNEYKVTGMPASLPSMDDKGLLIEMLDALVDDNPNKSPETITMKIASMSCKAAVKGNMKMSFAEADNLISQLMQADNPYNCPHGRPTLISISKYELEKKFKRIV